MGVNEQQNVSAAFSHSFCFSVNSESKINPPGLHSSKCSLPFSSRVPNRSRVARWPPPPLDAAAYGWSPRRGFLMWFWVGSWPFSLFPPRLPPPFYRTKSVWCGQKACGTMLYIKVKHKIRPDKAATLLLPFEILKKTRRREQLLLLGAGRWPSHGSGQQRLEEPVHWGFAWEKWEMNQFVCEMIAQPEGSW